MFNKTLKTFLFLSPLFTFKDYQVVFARGLFFITGSLLLYGISLADKPVRKYHNKWLSLFFGLALLRVFFDGDIGHGEYFNFWMAFSGFIYVFCGILLFKTVYCHVQNIKQFFKPILFVCIANFILVVCQRFNFDFMWLHTHEYGKHCGFLETPAQLGQYTAMTAPILFLINPFLSILPITILLLTKSVSVFLSLGAGLGFILAHLKRRKLYLLILSLVFVVGITANLGYIKRKGCIRLVMWKQTLRETLKKPYLGWGYRSFNRVVCKKEDRLGRVINATAYNDYFHTAQELGTPILLTGLIFLSGIFKRYFSIKNKDKTIILLMTSVLIILINMLGQTTIRYASISGTFLILLAFLNIGIDERIPNVSN